MVHISFDQGTVRFNFRVVGVALDHDRVLLHRAVGEAFWSLPGGRVELLEWSPQALRREMQEELGVEVEVGRLLWVTEYFFDYAERDYHELAFYYLMEVPSHSGLYENRAGSYWGQEHPVDREEPIKLEFRWFGLSELEDLRLYPTFLCQSLRAIPQTTQHILHKARH